MTTDPNFFFALKSTFFNRLVTSSFSAKELYYMFARINADTMKAAYTGFIWEDILRSASWHGL